ncbi:DNA-binding domain-containing protein, partial [Methylibium sp.]
MSAGLLIEQQRRLSRAVVEDDLAEATSAGGLLRSRAGGSLLHIYRHAYRARLVAALRENHEGLPRVMGDEAFDALAQAYLSAYPSRHPSIRWFGEYLADFMQARPALALHPS